MYSIIIMCIWVMIAELFMRLNESFQRFPLVFFFVEKNALIFFKGRDCNLHKINQVLLLGIFPPSSSSSSLSFSISLSFHFDKSNRVIACRRYKNESFSPYIHGKMEIQFWCYTNKFDSRNNTMFTHIMSYNDNISLQFFYFRCVYLCNENIYRKIYWTISSAKAKQCNFICALKCTRALMSHETYCHGFKKIQHLFVHLPCHIRPKLNSVHDL